LKKCLKAPRDGWIGGEPQENSWTSDVIRVHMRGGVACPKRGSRNRKEVLKGVVGKEILNKTFTRGEATNKKLRNEPFKIHKGLKGEKHEGGGTSLKR